MNTKFFCSLWLVVLLFCSGCMATRATTNKARTDKDGKSIGSNVEHPGWLALVPFAVVFDVATAPLQCVYLYYAFNDHSHCEHSHRASEGR